MARQDNDAAKQKVRDAFPIGRMKKFLSEKDAAVGIQFDVVYNTTIDFGAHPNTMAFTAHLSPVPGPTDSVWQYLNVSPVDMAMGLRVSATGGLNALNIFSLVFTHEMRQSGASELLVRAHHELDELSNAGSNAEVAAANEIVERSPEYDPSATTAVQNR